MNARRPKVFCAPGREERFAESLGRLPWKQSVEVGYIEIAGTFSEMGFSKRVDVIGHHVREVFWHESDLLLGRSFGAWILLNALMALDRRYPGTIILMSSVLGYGSYGGLHFIAPRASRFWEAAERVAHPPAEKLALLHAVDDEQCPYSQAQRLCEYWSIELVTFDEGGHELGKGTRRQQVSEAVRRLWLNEV